jgi:hypothetical protein
MRQGNGQDRQAQLLQFYQALPPMQQGLVICVLLGNALMVVTLDGVVVVAVIRGALHSWRRRRLGLGAAMRTGIGPALCGALGATAIQWVVARGLIRAVDTGRAAAWLERNERRLTASAGDQDESQ